MRKRNPKPSGMRKYWSHLTTAQANAERQKLSDAQNQCCAICGKHESNFKKKLSVDHNHQTGKVRALLCYYCNKFLVGRFRINTIVPVMKYLVKYDDPVANSNLLIDLVELIVDKIGDA